MTGWKWITAAREAAYRIRDDGAYESCSIWALPEGVVPEDPDPPLPPTQDELDAAEARQYAKLQALRAMTPGQVQIWIDANITDLASARDALKTLAVAVSVLARRL